MHLGTVGVLGLAAMLGSIALPTARGEPCPSTGAVVCDSNGSLVGTVLGNRSGVATVIGKIEGHPEIMSVTKGGFYPLAIPNFFVYEDRRCNGVPLIEYLALTPGFLLPEAALLNGRLYYPDPNDDGTTEHKIVAQQIIVSKKSQCSGRLIPVPKGYPLLCCVGQPARNVPAIQAISVDLDSLGLVPPFQIVAP